MNFTSRVFCRYRVEGFHNWPDAHDGRGYLAHTHRHMFHVEATVEQSMDRQVEFHDLLDQCRRVFNGGNLGSSSCESIAFRMADALFELYASPVVVTVSEDGECGSTVEVVR